MCKRQFRLFLLIATVLVFGLSPVRVGWQAFAAGLPEGVTLEVLAEYGPPGIPGIEKVTLKRLTMQPGTTSCFCGTVNWREDRPNPIIGVPTHNFV